jgi:hypothetical protein
MRSLDFSAQNIHDLFEYGRRCAGADQIWQPAKHALAHESSAQAENAQNTDCPAALNN